MSIDKGVTNVINALIEAAKHVFPFKLETEEPTLINHPFSNGDIGVLIGLTGDVKGTIIIEGKEDIFAKISEGLFGMVLEGEMLHSFAGELGNMMAGHLSTNLTKNGFTMDITPPTVLVGEATLHGFHEAYCIRAKMDNSYEILFYLIFETRKVTD
ncbi:MULTISPECIES: chemotaxis protein CheX [unclassified Bacillus (in: firmicutes)]|uniref:chemotaxis protein CheX n=1 Tax=unclassified Bacillus (in: firmicutes) TaxID=185979 RepID=UPI0020C89CB2|nr:MULTISPECIES: chemotaxis protein CheX [unclassified Bacillus (in: firmicutes)]